MCRSMVCHCRCEFTNTFLNSGHCSGMFRCLCSRIATVEVLYYVVGRSAKSEAQQLSFMLFDWRMWRYHFTFVRCLQCLSCSVLLRCMSVSQVPMEQMMCADMCFISFGRCVFFSGSTVVGGTIHQHTPANKTKDKKLSGVQMLLCGYMRV